MEGGHSLIVALGFGICVAEVGPSCRSVRMLGSKLVIGSDSFIGLAGRVERVGIILKHVRRIREEGMGSAEIGKSLNGFVLG